MSAKSNKFKVARSAAGNISETYPCLRLSPDSHLFDMGISDVTVIFVLSFATDTRSPRTPESMIAACFSG